MRPEKKMELLKELYGDWKNCTRCSLCTPAGRHRQHVVFGEGNPDAKILLVGDAPGHDEDASGSPFSGRAGEVVDDLLKSFNSGRHEVFITYVVACRPTEQDDARTDRKPSREEAKACSPRLDRIVEVVDPYVVILLGQVAMKSLTKEKRSISAVARGKLGPALEVETQGTMLRLTRPGFATFHPDYLLRNWNLEPGGDVHKTYLAFQKAFRMADTYDEIYNGNVPPQRKNNG